MSTYPQVHVRMETIGLPFTTITSLSNEDSLATVASQLNTLERLIAWYRATAFWGELDTNCCGRLHDMRRHGQPCGRVLTPLNITGAHDVEKALSQHQRTWRREQASVKAMVNELVYDTATRYHVLIPQGSTIHGSDQPNQLVYGDKRLDPVAMTVVFPHGQSVDFGRAPLVDQAGQPGLTDRIQQHWCRLFSAVFIGRILRGARQAVESDVATAGAAAQVAGGMARHANQIGRRQAGRRMNTRPTMEVRSGHQCHVLLVKE